MRKCLVIGGTGLIGTHLLRLLAREYETYALCLPGELCPVEDVRVIAGDLTHPDWTNTLPKEMDIVIHLAQSEHFRDFPEKARHVYQINTVSVLEALDYARKANASKFLYASSGGVYGFGDHPFDVDQSIDLNDNPGFYLATKLSSELIGKCFQSFFPVTTFRFFFVYGPEQKRHMLIPRLVDQVIEGRPITLQGEEGLIINPIHASDAARAIRDSIELKTSHVLNVGGKEVLSLKKIGEAIGKLAGKEPLFQVDLSAQPKSLIGEIQKTCQLLNWQPRVSFEEGAAELLTKAYA